MSLYSKKVDIKIDPKRIVLKKKGKDNTKSLRYYFLYEEIHISPWHDIPLIFNKSKKIFNFICEISKYTRKKFEIDTKSKNNPIKQDIKDNKLRSYKWGDIYFNYGCFPQTWEDPAHKTKNIKYPGDNDPLDAIEIGLKSLDIGSIVPVKIIGAIPMVDDNEIDWKIITIAADDILAKKVNNIESLNKIMPGFLNSVINWFRCYKTAEGKKENKFALDGRILEKKEAIDIIFNTHKLWRKLTELKLSKNI